MPRFVFVLLICCVLSGCARPGQNLELEHAPDAGAKGYLELTLYRPDENSRLLAEKKLLPLQTDMEGYALSFLLDDPAVTYRVETTNGRAAVDIASLPKFTDANAEAAAVAGIVNTLLAMHGVSEAALTFDGEKLNALPQGTDVSGVFTVPLAMDATE